MRAHDWAGTPLGPVAGWPESLRSTLGLCLDSAFPMAIYWGPQLVLVYNEAWRPILGDKHPWAMGRPAREVWPEIWRDIEPIFEKVLASGQGVFIHDGLLAMNRFGYVEECYFDYTFNPIRSGRDVAGIFNVVVETTYRVISERRAQVQRNFVASLGGAQSADEVIALGTGTLAASHDDVPFALLYRVPDGGRTAHLVRAVGIEAGAAAAPLCIELDQQDVWPLGGVIETGEPEHVADLGRRFGRLPGGPWPEASREALVLPVAVAGDETSKLLLVAGISPRRALDLEYRTFFQSLASHLGAALTNVAALDSERRRAEALVQLDQAKTLFFSNVSHEFRTPLTLMMGPLEDVLAQPERLDAGDRERLELAHRNSLRLLKLVNTLLDFSRIEAGRMQAAYVATDLSAYTADLASVFRSAMERAGLRLEVDCPPLPEPVHVDRTMWEKIVFNLLSNAFKFTFEGAIAVKLRAGPERVQLTVSDTGTGIPPADLPRLFEHFHRVEGARGRSFEGSGIGLALVQELVKLHGGTVEVESQTGRGTAFVISLPRGIAHLPADRILADAPAAGQAGAHSQAGGDIYIREMLRWLPEADPEQCGQVQRLAPEGQPRLRVLLADDNVDMRDYATRLLREHYEVVAVADGEAALQAARSQPFDLVLSDVMMPGLDGFGLLAALRADTRTSMLPVILLSARAGEEARLEGLGRGADDYMVKPFNARELLMRVSGLLQSSRRVRAFADAAPAMLWVTEPDGRCSFLSRRWFDFTGQTQEQALGMGWTEAVHPEDRERSGATFLKANSERKPFTLEYRLRQRDGEYRWCIDAGQPRYGEGDAFAGFIGSVIDVHDRHQAQEALREREAFSRTVIESSQDCIKIFSPEGRIQWINDRGLKVLQAQPEDILGRLWVEFWSEDQQPAARAAIEAARKGGKGSFLGSLGPQGAPNWWDVTITPLDDASGGFLAISRDISEAVAAREALREEAQALETLNRIGAALAGELDLQRTVQVVTDAATKVTGAQFGALFYKVTDAEGKPDMMFTLSGAPREAFEKFGMPRNTAVFAPTFGGEGVVRVDDITRDPRYGKNAPHHGMPSGHLPVRSYLALPVMSRSGEVMGGLFFGHPQPGVFSERAERLVTAIAAQAAVAIDNARLYQQRVQLIEQLRDEDRRKDEFIATLSHELRNPLAPLRNSLHFLRQSGKESQETAPVHAMMERQVNYLVRLVDDLLEISRISRGAFELRKERVEVAAVVQSALETSDPLIRAGGHSLELRQPPQPLWMDGDPVRLAQILANLLNNAAKYTPDGGRIEVNVSRDDSSAVPQAVISVRDNGVGIAAGALPRIFDMFSRGDHAGTADVGGLGIGLALARRLAEMHGGSITAGSAGAGQGSEFVVRLPLATAQGEAHRPDQPDSAAPGRRRRVLVVDDNQDAADSLALVLEMLFTEVKVAHSGEEALTACAAFRPEVVLLDIGMPGMDGYEVARRIRGGAAGRDARPVLVALTGWGQEEDKRRASEAGFDHHIIKPADIGILERLLTAMEATEGTT